MTELRTEGPSLDPIGLEDTEFVLELLNDPGWIANIGDRGVHTVKAARAYIRDRFMKSTWFVARDAAGRRFGICGLVEREGLPRLDIGYAILEGFSGRGYATEAARAVLGYARGELGQDIILAMTAPENKPSQKVLEKIGLHFVERVDLPGGEPRGLTSDTGRKVRIAHEEAPALRRGLPLFWASCRLTPA